MRASARTRSCVIALEPDEQNFFWKKMADAADGNLKGGYHTPAIWYLFRAWPTPADKLGFSGSAAKARLMTSG